VVNSVTVTAGDGLSGGGDLTANRTLSVSYAGSGGNFGSATSVSRSNHLHDYVGLSPDGVNPLITANKITSAYIPFGPTSVEVATGNHSHSAPNASVIDYTSDSGGLIVAGVMSVQAALDILDDHSHTPQDAAGVAYSSDAGGLLGTGIFNVQAALDYIDDNVSTYTQMTAADNAVKGAAVAFAIALGG
jgi:hypothetical protein